ncbi:class I SAM-dependent methyltransferase [Paraferrimonas sp. SM1919]|uniref:class I SAM-dependent methyltransferase n=1 Tax=Paraferrimonas sp. SM1919 TaxID=2662263 RepID=UPI0013D46F84|nr:class I SAM-dependent methyltransferase [Paraferrimonas sp. SM1919]
MKLAAPIAVAISLALSACSGAKQEVTAPAFQAQSELLAAVNGELRQDKNKARDAFRHPYQTLEFFDVKPTDTVVELWPGGGWYSEILAPYLKDNGKLIAAGFETNPSEDTRASQFYKKSGLKYQAWLTDNQAQVGDVTVTVLNPPAKTKLAADGTVDAVLTFRNLHNWAKRGQLESVLKASYAALKPGGVFGVVEHRGPEGEDYSSGYMQEQAFIDLAISHGFRLAAKSEINANPKDTKDHPKGVWTLPPRLALGDTDKETYLAIGESDRMTLKFVK